MTPPGSRIRDTLEASCALGIRSRRTHGPGCALPAPPLEARVHCDAAGQSHPGHARGILRARHPLPADARSRLRSPAAARTGTRSLSRRRVAASGTRSRHPARSASAPDGRTAPAKLTRRRPHRHAFTKSPPGSRIGGTLGASCALGISCRRMHGPGCALPAPPAQARRCRAGGTSCEMEGSVI